MQSAKIPDEDELEDVKRKEIPWIETTIRNFIELKVALMEKEIAQVGLPDLLANKNTCHLIKFKFQINNE